MYGPLLGAGSANANGLTLYGKYYRSVSERRRKLKEGNGIKDGHFLKKGDCTKKIQGNQNQEI